MKKINLSVVDERILKFTQTISDQVQDLTGITCITIGKIFLVSCFVFSSALVTSSILAKNAELFWGIIGVQTMASCSAVLIINKLNRESTTSNAAFRNPLEQQFAKKRLIYIAYMIIGLLLVGMELSNDKDSWYVIGITSLALNSISQFCMIYFMSCTPKPPSKSKLKKLMHSIREAFTPRPTLVPQV